MFFYKKFRRRDEGRKRVEYDPVDLGSRRSRVMKIEVIVITVKIFNNAYDTFKKLRSAGSGLRSCSNDCCNGSVK